MTNASLELMRGQTTLRNILGLILSRIFAHLTAQGIRSRTMPLLIVQLTAH